MVYIVEPHRASKERRLGQVPWVPSATMKAMCIRGAEKDSSGNPHLEGILAKDSKHAVL